MRDRLLKAIEAILLEVYTVPNQQCSDHLNQLKEKLERAEKHARRGEMVQALEVISGET